MPDHIRHDETISRQLIGEEMEDAVLHPQIRFQELLHGIQRPLMPMLGLPDHALSFDSPQSAFDCPPAVLHHDMEVVHEDCRFADAEAWRLQNASIQWAIELFHSPDCI
jgi:hypothetical protein